MNRGNASQQQGVALIAFLHELKDLFAWKTQALALTS